MTLLALGHVSFFLADFLLAFFVSFPDFLISISFSLASFALRRFLTCLCVWRFEGLDKKSQREKESRGELKTLIENQQ